MRRAQKAHAGFSFDQKVVLAEFIELAKEKKWFPKDDERRDATAADMTLQFYAVCRHFGQEVVHERSWIPDDMAESKCKFLSWAASEWGVVTKGMRNVLTQSSYACQ